MFEKFKTLPRKVQVAFAVIAASIMLATWASPQVLKVVDDWKTSPLERVNVIAATELFGMLPVETYSAKSIDAEVTIFKEGALVRVRSSNGTRQSQFFPAEGVEAFLRYYETSPVDVVDSSVFAYAIAADKGGRKQKVAPPPAPVEPPPPPRCVEKFLSYLSPTTALFECRLVDCVELYVVDLATGEIVDRRSPVCLPQ